MVAVMVQGCSSWAGKSLVATALCRWYSDRGFSVAPFKAQNMANNARVVAGGEMGTAQYLQALAARVQPQVTMNPVLVKPESSGSQVVVLGQEDASISDLPWTERPDMLWPTITQSLDQLLSQFDVVVCEGAGSPAEVNLQSTDLSNMKVARYCGAPVILVGDIDRGGAFAHLYGTWALQTPADQARLAAFVLNKFRGDAKLLGDGPDWLARQTGMQYLGLLPMLAHDLPDEDGARDISTNAGSADSLQVAIIRYPTASNLDEFWPLSQVAKVTWAGEPGDLAAADLIVLPGSKDVPADLRWLRSRFGDVLQNLPDKRILGICGGLQMLGESIQPPGSVEPIRGLGLLPVRTEYWHEKNLGEVELEFGAELPPHWQGLAGLPTTCYDIRYGETRAFGPVAQATKGTGFAVDNVMGVASHGFFTNLATVSALTGHLPGNDLERTFDELSSAVSASLDEQLLLNLVNGSS